MKRKYTPEELRGLRQLANGVMYHIELCTGRAPSPRTARFATRVFNVLGWCMVAALCTATAMASL